MRSRVKKVSTRGGGYGNGGTDQIASWKCNCRYLLGYPSIYLDIKAITTLLCLLLVLYVLVPSIYSIFFLTTALLKSDIFRHSKAYSHSFQPTGIRLGSLWRGNRCVLSIISAYLSIGYFLFFKVAYFAPQKICTFQKIP